MENNEPAKRIFDAWLAPLRDIGVRRNVIEGIGATDHVSFDRVGIPAFNVIKDFHNTMCARATPMRILPML
jgi:carboxypeptidase Q